MHDRVHRGIYDDLKGLEQRIHEALHDMERLDNYYGGDGDGIARDHHDLGQYLADTLSRLATRLLIYSDALALPGAQTLVSAWVQRWKATDLAQTRL